ncbi:MAG: outer membrane beta-barrel protein, partial [Flavobacteriales bacterium]
IAGNAGYSSSTTDVSGDTDPKVSGGSFGPQYGYWVNDNIAVGIGLSYSSSTAENGTEGGALDYKTKEMTGFSVSPFVRYYKKMDKFALYGELNIGIGSGKTSWSDVTAGSSPVEVPDAETKSFSLNVGPGVQYWFSDNWSMNTTIGLLSYGTDTQVGQDGADDVVTSDLNFGLDMTSLNFGLNYHF